VKKKPVTLPVVKYKVTTLFGDKSKGDIVDAYVLFQDGHLGILYHPKGDKYSCASIGSCIYLWREDVWVAIHEDAYVNIEAQKSIDLIVARLKKIKYNVKSKKLSKEVE